MHNLIGRTSLSSDIRLVDCCRPICKQDAFADWQCLSAFVNCFSRNNLCDGRIYLSLFCTYGEVLLIHRCSERRKSERL